MLVEAVKDYAIFMLDRDGNIATWNPGAELIKQYKATEIIGKSTFHASTQKTTCETESHSGNWLSQRRKDNSKMKAGGYEKMDRCFGLM